MSRRHNPEKRAWRGRSYKKGGTRVRDIREQFESAEDLPKPIEPEPFEVVYDLPGDFTFLSADLKGLD